MPDEVGYPEKKKKNGGGGGVHDGREFVRRYC